MISDKYFSEMLGWTSNFKSLFAAADLRICLQNSLSLKVHDPSSASLFDRTRLI